MSARPSDKRPSFNEVPDVYDEIRPSYPAELYDALFEMLPPEPAILENDGRFSRVELRTWDWNQTYTAADYRKLMLSYSQTHMMAPDQRQGLLDDMESFITEHFNGRVTRPLVATLTTARRS